MSARLVRIGAVLVAASAAVAAPSGGRGEWSTGGFVDVTGPLERVVLDWAPIGRTVVELSLAAGERRRLRVPVPRAPVPSAAPEPELRVDGAGRARFSAPGAAPTETSWPAPLGRRGLPPVRTRDRRLPIHELVACAALCVFVLALRRRPLGALALGGAGALLWLVMPRSAGAGPAPGAIEVLEGRPEDDVWLRVERWSLGGPSAVFVAGADDRIELEPPRVAVEWTVGAGARWTARAGAGILTRRSPAAPVALDVETNGHGPLAPVFVRSPDGRWRRFERWDRGAPAPAGELGDDDAGATGPTPPDPPGWIRQALPLGRWVVTGRRDGPREGRGERWVRVVVAPGN